MQYVEEADDVPTKVALKYDVVKQERQYTPGL